MSVLLLAILLKAGLTSSQDSLQTLTCSKDSDCHEKVDSKLLSCQNGKCVLMTMAERKQREKDESKDYSNVMQIPPDPKGRQTPGLYPLMITGQRMQGAPAKSTPIPAANSLNSMDNFNLEDELENLDEDVNESFEEDDIDPRAFLTDEMLEKLQLGESITITPFPSASTQPSGLKESEIKSQAGNGQTVIPGDSYRDMPNASPSKDGETINEINSLPPITLPFTEVPVDLTRTSGPRPTEPIPVQHPPHDHESNGHGPPGQGH